MLNKRNLCEAGDSGGTPKRSKKSWKEVTAAVRYYEEEKYEKALPLLLKHEDTEARAIFLLGCMYWNGYGVTEDVEMAVDYMHKLVKFQHIRPEDIHLLAMAFYFIGDLYYRGFALAKDDNEAERYWRLGAVLNVDAETGEQYLGTTKCQSALGMFYSDPKNEAKAFYWHKKAAQSGCVISEAALGVMYMYGIGTEENFDIAYNHLTNAAVLDNVYAKGYLAAFHYKRQMYHRTVILGRELSGYQDYALLADMNDCSIEHVKQGVAVGCFYLALCMQYGYCMGKNIKESKKLIKRALEISTDIACDLHEKAISSTL